MVNNYVKFWTIVFQFCRNICRLNSCCSEANELLPSSRIVIWLSTLAENNRSFLYTVPKINYRNSLFKISVILILFWNYAWGFHSCHASVMCMLITSASILGFMNVLWSYNQTSPKCKLVPKAWPFTAHGVYFSYLIYLCFLFERWASDLLFLCPLANWLCQQKQHLRRQRASGL